MVLILFALSCCTNFLFLLILAEFFNYQKYGECSDYYRRFCFRQILFLMHSLLVLMKLSISISGLSHGKVILQQLQCKKNMNWFAIVLRVVICFIILTDLTELPVEFCVDEVFEDRGGLDVRRRRIGKSSSLGMPKAPQVNIQGDSSV